MDQFHRDDVLNMIQSLNLDLSLLNDHDQKKLIADALLKACYIPLEEAVSKAYNHAITKTPPTD